MCICLSVLKLGKWISASISDPLAEGNSAKIWQRSPYGCHVQNNHVQSSTVFSAVETNCRFVPVATFILGSETTGSIRECLEAFHQANPSCHPTNFVVEYSLPEIPALESVFSRNHFGLHTRDERTEKFFSPSPVLIRQNWIRSSPGPQNFWKSSVRPSPDPPMQNHVFYFASWGKTTTGAVLPLDKYDWFKAK